MEQLTKAQDILNTLKWQLIARLPHGSIYTRVEESLKNPNLSSLDPFYYIYWLDLNRSLFKKFTLGTFKTINSDYIPFITWLDTNYQKNNHYEIKIGEQVIKIPRPSLEDYKCFKAEFLDIIMPSITGDDPHIPYLEGPYEYGNVRLKPNDIVLDLGANYGLFSSLALSKLCDVYAFEPTREVVTKYLEHLSKLDSHLHIITKAVSNATGSAFLKTNPYVSSCNSLTSEDPINPNIIPIKTVTVDDFVLESHLPRVDFIKADIEGSERLMLEGAKETIKEFAPKLAICYYHCFDDLKVLTRLIQTYNPHYEIVVKYKKIYCIDTRK